MESDLTQRIRDSIKKKLVELDSYVDNELPDYIMVMVANKKSKECMESDLSLFLGKNTSTFTNWLHAMLEKVEADASGELGGNTSISDEAQAAIESTAIGEEVVTTSIEDEEDILALETNVQDDDYLCKELQEGTSSVHKLEENRDTRDQTPPAATEADGVEKETKSKTFKDVVAKQKQEINKTLSQRTKSSYKSPVISLKQMPYSFMEPEYDPLNPALNAHSRALKSVASTVHVSERKSSVPPALQANKLLLLKAVDDANRSIVGKQNVSEIYHPTPIKILKRPSEETLLNQKNSAFRQSNDSSRSYHERSSRKRNASEVFGKEPSFHKLRPNLVQINTQDEIERYSPECVKRDVQITSELECGYGEILDEDNTNNPPSPVSPHFVVTLNGIDASSFKDKWTDAFSESSDVENVSAKNSENAETPSPTKNEKPVEKCRYWPTCINGDTCPFFHPTVPCKAFPNCGFGDKCHFIHPNCKFDSLCSRKDCPYTHVKRREYANARTAPSILSAVPSFKFQAAPVSYRTTICKFFPNCNSYTCPYLHPKKCKFGGKCKSPHCLFTHPNFPSRSQLTWKSQSS